jgi:uncharacterized tellurite resistance protein B-like protein
MDPEEFTEEQRFAFVEAMANIVAADRKVTPEERQQLEMLVIGVGLSPGDERVRRAIAAQLETPQPLAAILKKLGRKDLHAAVFRLLCEAACADGEIQPEERAKILEAAAEFGYEKNAASELVDWTLQSIGLERREKDILARLG